MATKHPRTNPYVSYHDLTGQRFGRLLVLNYAGSNGRRALWNCRCDCGAFVVALGKVLLNGGTRSCGCLRREITSRRNRTVRFDHPAEGAIWQTMKDRCFNPRNKDFADYGGRGITVCDRWSGSKDFVNFLTDMGPRPAKGYWLERIDNDGNYEPRNCRWATPKEEQRNRRDNHPLTHNGLTLCISGWAEQTGLADSTIRRRLHRGWSVTDALMTPLRKYPAKLRKPQD